MSVRQLTDQKIRKIAETLATAYDAVASEVGCGEGRYLWQLFPSPYGAHFDALGVAYAVQYGAMPAGVSLSPAGGEGYAEDEIREIGMERAEKYFRKASIASLEQELAAVRKAMAMAKSGEAKATVEKMWEEFQEASEVALSQLRKRLTGDYLFAVEAKRAQMTYHFGRDITVLDGDDLFLAVQLWREHYEQGKLPSEAEEVAFLNALERFEPRPAVAEAFFTALPASLRIQIHGFEAAAEILDSKSAWATPSGYAAIDAFAQDLIRDYRNARQSLAGEGGPIDLLRIRQAFDAVHAIMTLEKLLACPLEALREYAATTDNPLNSRAKAAWVLAMREDRGGEAQSLTEAWMDASPVEDPYQCLMVDAHIWSIVAGVKG